MQLSEEDWKQRLTPEQYQVLREKGTEKPHSGIYLYCDKKGIYLCAGCGQPLFSSADKFDAGTGWPSFSKPIKQESVTYASDHKLLYERTEVLCNNCHGHLGHVFEGNHYCINSVALNFEESS